MFIFLFLVSALNVSAEDSTLKVNYNLTTNIDKSWGSGSTISGIASNFTNSTSFYPMYALVYLKKSGSPTDCVYVQILNGSTYSFLINSSTCISGTTLTTSYAWYNFTFNLPTNYSAYNLAGGQYLFAVRRTGSVDAVNYYVIRTYETAGGGEIAYQLNSGVWEGYYQRSYLSYQIFGVSMIASSPFTFTAPSESGTTKYLPNNYLLVNVTTNITNFVNMTLNVYNQTSIIYSNTTTLNKSFWNVTLPFINNTYYYNITARNTTNTSIFSNTYTNYIVYSYLNITATDGRTTINTINLTIRDLTTLTETIYGTTTGITRIPIIQMKTSYPNSTTTWSTGLLTGQVYTKSGGMTELWLDSMSETSLTISAEGFTTRNIPITPLDQDLYTDITRPSQFCLVLFVCVLVEYLLYLFHNLFLQLVL